MKKITLILAFICSIATTAQEAFFPGANPELLVGKKVKVDFTEGYATGFYKNAGLTNSMNTSDDFKKLNGKVFTVKGLNTKKASYKSFILENDEIGKCYYSYRESDASKYYLLVEDLNLPADYFCSVLTETKDSSGDVNVHAPYRKDYSLYKSGKTLAVTFHIHSSEIDVKDKILVKVKFSDSEDQYISFKSSTSTEYGKQGWDYSLTWYPDAESLEMLKTKTLLQLTVVGSTKKLSAAASREIQEYIKCFTK